VTFDAKNQLSSIVIADQYRFRLCLRILLEFGIIYTKDQNIIGKSLQIPLKARFDKADKIADEQYFVYEFTISLTPNPQYNIEALNNLFSD